MNMPCQSDCDRNVQCCEKSAPVFSVFELVSFDVSTVDFFRSSFLRTDLDVDLAVTFLESAFRALFFFAPADSFTVRVVFVGFPEPPFTTLPGLSGAPLLLSLAWVRGSVRFGLSFPSGILTPHERDSLQTRVFSGIVPGQRRPLLYCQTAPSQSPGLNTVHIVLPLEDYLTSRHWGERHALLIDITASSFLGALVSQGV